MLVAAGTELSNDEVYYRLYALHLQWNYFDHPPMIAVLMRIFTANLLTQQEFFLRLGSIICAAINTWQIYLIGRRLKDEYTGWLSACFFTASIYAGILAGLMILPDAPQMVFWLGAASVMLNILRPDTSKRKKNRQLILSGILIGLCIMSKVHGLFLWAGFFLYLILYQRKMLRNPYLYLAVLTTGIIVLPILLWNINNNFVTYLYHSNRVSIWNSKIQWDGFGRQVIGEFLYNNPINVVVIVISLFAAKRMKLTNELYQQRLLLLLSLPLICIVWLLALFRDTLPHWTGPAYTMLILLAAAYIRNTMATKGKFKLLPATIKASLILPLFLLTILLYSVNKLPAQIGSKDELRLGAGDPLLDMSGWNSFAWQFRKLYENDLEKGNIRNPVTIVTDYWFPAAHLDYYVARPAGLNFLAVGSLNNIHQYAWINPSRTPLLTGQDAYYIAVSNYFDPLPLSLASCFDKTEAPVIIPQYREKVIVRNFYIYRLRGYKGGIPQNGVIAN